MTAVTGVANVTTEVTSATGVIIVEATAGVVILEVVRDTTAVTGVTTAVAATAELETAVTIAVAKEEIAATTEAANTAAEIDKNEGKIFLQAIGFARVVRITITPRVMFVIEGIAPPPAQRMAVLTTVVATAGHNTAAAAVVATEEAVTSETTVVATAGHNTAAAGMAKDAVVATVDLKAPAAIADHRSEAIVQTLTENLPASIGSLAM